MNRVHVGCCVGCCLGCYVGCVAQEAAPGSDVCRDLNDSSVEAVSRVKRALEGGNGTCRYLRQE